MVEDLAAYLVATVGGLTSGTNLFAGYMPDKPDICAVLYDQAGMPPIDTGGGGSKPAVARPRLQVMNRGTTYPTARDAARSVYNALVLVASSTLSGHTYQRIAAVQEPNLLHNDAENRWIFVCNYEVWRDPE